MRERISFVSKKQNRAYFRMQDVSLWGDNNVGWLHYGEDNGSGSLLSMWCKEAFCYESHVMGKGFIAVFGQ